MITLRDLDGLKLVTDENNIATVGEALAEFERSVEQGSQNWGVRREQAVTLRFATELSRRIAAADKYEETQKALKAEQMRRGRIQKTLDGAAASLEVQDRTIGEQNKKIATLKTEVDAAEAATLALLCKDAD